MRVRLLALFILLDLVAGCAPEKKCGGNLIFSDASGDCIPCPMNSTPKNDTCECNSGFVMKGSACVAIVADSGMMEPSDDDSGTASMASGATCMDYCGFTTKCVGGNSLAQSVLPEVYTGLHADDAAACKSSCQKDVGSGESTNKVLACIKDGEQGAKCDDANAQTGLTTTFGIIGDCCGANQSDALCKSICTALKSSALVAGMVMFCP